MSVLLGDRRYALMRTPEGGSFPGHFAGAGLFVMMGTFDTVRSPLMQPLFVATETFTSQDSEVWAKYVSWSHLNHLTEVVSLDAR